jgi:hypothetical protein
LTLKDCTSTLKDYGQWVLQWFQKILCAQFLSVNGFFTFMVPSYNTLIAKACIATVWVSFATDKERDGPRGEEHSILRTGDCGYLATSPLKTV